MKENSACKERTISTSINVVIAHECYTSFPFLLEGSFVVQCFRILNSDTYVLRSLCNRKSSCIKIIESFDINYARK